MKKNETPETRSNNYAAIDIGSNAVRLLIKHADDNGTEVRFSKVLMLRVPLRLGFDVFSCGKISEEKAKNLLRLMKSYRQLMKIYQVDAYRACATSAMRDASNGNSIIQAVEKKTRIRIDIIDGEEEAQIVYNNHIEYMRNSKSSLLYVDVGGGSTEVSLVNEGQRLFSRSYNVGTVRMLNHAVAESEWERLKTDMETLAKTYPGTNIIGSGGNINKLYRLAERKSKAEKRFSVESLSAIHEKLKMLSVEERMHQFNLKPDRADVIVPAGEIFMAIATSIGAESIYVPVLGLSDGIIDSLFARTSQFDSVVS